MEEKGYWLCEDGHEAYAGVKPDGTPGDPFTSCPTCGKSVKLISRATMSGQEKYESDNERGEAEKIIENKREQAKAEEENAAGSEKTAKYFLKQAANGRAVAQKIKKLRI